VILYLYAFAGRIGEIGDLTGAGGEPIVHVELANAVVLAGWLERAPPLDRASLAAQDRLLRALHDRADALLPLRFGTVMADLDAARRAVEAISADLPRRLARVRGREQMTLRAIRARTRTTGATGTAGTGATGAPGATGATGTGTAYLRRRAQTLEPPEIVAVLDATRELQRAARIEPGRDDAVVATVYHLIDRGRGDEYRQRTETAANAAPDLTLRVSGPGPAYAFADSP
jgi:hypothetical protein